MTSKPSALRPEFSLFSTILTAIFASVLRMLTQLTIRNMGILANFHDRFFFPRFKASFAFALPSLVAIFLLAILTLCTTNACGQSGDDNLDLSVLEAEDVNSDSENAVSQVPQDSEPANPAGDVRFFELVKASGWIGLILLLLSIIAVALVIRICFSLRSSIFLPQRLKEGVSRALAVGDVQGALTVTADFPSYAGSVLGAGLQEAYRGWNAVEKGVEDSSASITAKLYRTTEPLSLIGNVAPMLGLLGTVMGMVSTFGELAVTDGSGRNLANGIYFALVTTVAGLLVAIPVLVAHSLLNGRLASLISATNDEIFHLLAPLRRATSNIRFDSRVPEQPARQIHGLQEISSSKDETRTSEQDNKSTRPSGRPALSLKNRRPDGE